MDLKLNIKDNSIRKKRGISIFERQSQANLLPGHLELDEPEQMPQKSLKKISTEKEIVSAMVRMNH